MNTLHASSDTPFSFDKEQSRLQALEDYNILDTAPEEKLDNLAALASYICGTPTSLISLVTQDRQWFKAKIGFDKDETPRSMSFCQHAILEDDVLEIPDTMQDIRFFSNPLVTGNPNIRFYAGAPLVNTEGYKLGTLCVIDTQPRELTEAQKRALATLSEQVVAHFELRRKNQELEQEKNQLRLVNEKLNGIMTLVREKLPEPIIKLELLTEALSQEASNNNGIDLEKVKLLSKNIADLKDIYTNIKKAS